VGRGRLLKMAWQLVLSILTRVSINTKFAGNKVFMRCNIKLHFTFQIFWEEEHINALGMRGNIRKK